MAKGGWSIPEDVKARKVGSLLVGAGTNPEGETCVLIGFAKSPDHAPVYYDLTLEGAVVMSKALVDVFASMVAAGPPPEGPSVKDGPGT